MSEQEYEDLWHYSEQFTRDKLQRSELITIGVELSDSIIHPILFKKKVAS